MNLRIFAYEYTCAAGPDEAGMPSSFQTEGWAMLLAILTDLGRVPGVELMTLLNPRMHVPTTANPCRVVRADEEEGAFRELAHAADFTLVIAPEVHDALWTRCCWVEECGSRLLGPAPAAVRITGDKLELCRHLRQHH